jgi:hypothetical protein
MRDLGLLVLKILAVVGAAALGALVVGFVVRLAARAVSTREVPRPVMTTLRILGAVAAGLAVWLWVFSPAGPEGWGGGGGGWWPFGKSGTGTGTGTGSASGEQRPPATSPAPTQRHDTLSVTMRGGGDAESKQEFYVLEGDKPRTLKELGEVILQRRQHNPELKFIKIVTTDESVADNHGAVRQLKDWARAHNLETVGP